MYRIILELPWFTIYSYGLLMVLGFGIAVLYFLASIKKEGISGHLMLNLVIGITLFAIIGARVFYILIHLNHYILHPKEIYRL